jgi:hypothetical protein
MALAISFLFDLLFNLTEVKGQNVAVSWHVSLLFHLEHFSLVRTFI